MALALIIIGTIFLAAAIRGKQELLFDTLKDDFTGSNNFIYWSLAIIMIGAVGYYRPIKPLSNAFMVLLFIVIMLSQEGFFGKFMSQIRS